MGGAGAPWWEDSADSVSVAMRMERIWQSQVNV
jgi:hypothetical protein